MVGSPVVHYIISCLKRAFFTITSWSEPCTWPCIVSTFPQFIRNFFRQSYCPAFCDLQNRSQSFHKIQTNHSCRHLCFCFKSGRESTATEVSQVCIIPCGICHDRILIFFCYFIPRFHHCVAISIFCFCICIQTASTGVDQMDKSACILRYTFQIISGSFLNCFWAPVGTNISKHLRAVGKKFHEQHTHTVQNIILCCKNVWLSCSVPVKGSIQHSLREVTVRIEVCPLSLSLESCCDRIVTNFFFFTAFRQIFITIHQVFDDTHHLNYEFPVRIFLFTGLLQFFRILVKAFDTFFFGPCKSFFIFCMIINTFSHTANDFYLVNRLYTHSQILFEERWINDRSANTHTDGTDLQIRFSSHSCTSNSCTSKSQQFFFNVSRDRSIICILNIMSIDTKCRKTFLSMCSKYRCQIYSTRSFCSVESPNSFDGIWIHIHSLSSVAPAWSNSQCNINAFFFEFCSTCSSLCYTSDCCISDYNLNRFTVAISQIFCEQFSSGFCHIHGLLFQRFTNFQNTTTSVNCWSDTNYRVIAN